MTYEAMSGVGLTEKVLLLGPCHRAAKDGTVFWLKNTISIGMYPASGKVYPVVGVLQHTCIVARGKY